MKSICSKLLDYCHRITNGLGLWDAFIGDNKQYSLKSENAWIQQKKINRD
jgi:hypothetical protein